MYSQMPEWGGGGGSGMLKLQFDRYTNNDCEFRPDWDIVSYMSHCQKEVNENCGISTAYVKFGVWMKGRSKLIYTVYVTTS